MIQPLGDSALLVQLGDAIDPAINQKVHALDALLNANTIAGILETVPAYCTLLVHYDPLTLTYAQASHWVLDEFSRMADSLNRIPRRLEIPVIYNTASDSDLSLVAAAKGISPAEAIRLHSEREYTVYMMGFTPGFPYMGKLDEHLIMPRLETPRTRVPAGSVAIAGEQTGIYPLESPGGWHLIGWTPLTLFDPQSETPFLFAPGDVVKFVPTKSERGLQSATTSAD